MYFDRINGAIICISCDHSHTLDHSHTRIDATKYSMLVVEQWQGLERDVELTGVGVRLAGVGHGNDASPSVFQVPTDLIFKLSTVYAFTSAPRPGGVASLDHEVPDDAMKNRAVVVAGVSQGSQVVASARGVFVVQLNHERSLLQRRESDRHLLSVSVVIVPVAATPQLVHTVLTILVSNCTCVHGDASALLSLAAVGSSNIVPIKPINFFVRTRCCCFLLLLPNPRRLRLASPAKLRPYTKRLIGS